MISLTQTFDKILLFDIVQQASDILCEFNKVKSTTYFKKPTLRSDNLSAVQCLRSILNVYTLIIVTLRFCVLNVRKVSLVAICTVI